MIIQKAKHIALIKKEIYVCGQSKLKEVRYSCSAHRYAHFFTIAVSTHSHKVRKQPQIILP